MSVSRWPLEIIILHAVGVQGGIMDDEMLRVSDGSWHRAHRKSVSFQSACGYLHEPELPHGCQYNMSKQPVWTEDERRAEEWRTLKSFYDSTKGKLWRSNDNWLVGDPCWDLWYGVTCDEHGHVIGLHLSDNSLAGTLPFDFTRLQGLLTLDLSSTASDYHGHANLYMNRLTGLVPTLKDMARLEEIEISGNLFTDFPEDLYQNADTLKVVSASHNQLRSFPRYLTRFTKLQVLDLSHNRIYESFPATFGSVTAARFVYLQYNSIVGMVPKAIANLEKIRVFDISHNPGIGGEFPKDVIPTWPEVEYLSILNTSLTGYIPSLCADVPFCYKFMFDTHGDLTWAGAGEVPDIVAMTLELAA